MKLTKLLEQKKITTIGDLLELHKDVNFINDHGWLEVLEANLTSLEGFPDGVNALEISYNELTSLKGFKQSNPNRFDWLICSYNKLTSLEHGPTVLNRLDCRHNKLTNLLGGPTEVHGDEHCAFNCSFNKITSLEGAPHFISGSIIDLRGNKLKSLQNIHKYIKQVKPGCELWLGGNDIKSHMIGVLKIKDLAKINMLGTSESDPLITVVDIINKHLQGDRNIFNCQAELEDAGYEKYAQL